MRNGTLLFDSGARQSTTIRGVLATLLILAVTGGVVGVLALGSVDVAGAWRAVIDDRDFLNRLGFSLAQAAAATGIGLVVGLPASWFLSRGSLPLRGLLLMLVVAPLALPGLVVGMGIDVVAGGVILPRVLVVLAHAVFATATVAWLVTPAWSGGQTRLAEDARLLGAGRLRAYLLGPGRLVPSAIRVSAALTFWCAFASAGAVAIVGGGDAATTESVLAFGEPVGLSRPSVDGINGAQQAAIALIQILIGVAVLASGGPRWPRMGAVPARSGRGVTIIGTLYLLTLAAALWAPLGLVVREAAAGGAVAGLMDTNIGGDTVPSLLLWTGVLAGLSALAATLTAWLGSGLLARRGGRRASVLARWSLVLPAALTGASLGWAGLVLASRVGVDLDRTYLMTVAAHALLAYPFALRILGTRRPVDVPLLEDAVMLGASTRSVRWRGMGRRTVMALASAFLIAAVLSVGEVAATSLLTPANATPAALGLLSAWVSSGAGDGVPFTDEGYALAAALAVVTVIAFAGAEWLRRAAARVEAG